VIDSAHPVDHLSGEILGRPRVPMAGRSIGNRFLLDIGG